VWVIVNNSCGSTTVLAQLVLHYELKRRMATAFSPVLCTVSKQLALTLGLTVKVKTVGFKPST
jgi:hypothetical protein